MSNKTSGNKSPGISSDERTWAMACHLSAFAGWLIPFGNIIGPLVVWLIKRDAFPLVNEHGKESLNFQLSLTIYFIVSLLLVFVIIGFFLIIALAIAQIILIILATVKANDGLSYQYPITIRFIK